MPFPLASILWITHCHFACPGIDFQNAAATNIFEVEINPMILIEEIPCGGKFHELSVACLRAEQR